MKKVVEDEIEEKLKYLGLDLNNVPETLKIFEPINYRVTKKYEENKYKQYRFVPIKDIEILLTPTNRLNSIEEKYSKASPIYSYLVPDTEENILKHATFLNMLKTVRVEDIEKIEAEQKQLSAKVPFKVKYPGNYLWQIYYSESTDKYFMLVPTEDSDYSAFFFLLKKQLEKRKSGKIFVPISHIDYSRGLLSKSEIEDIENYLWLFTKDWPSIYEVHDKTDKISMQIVGETEIYEKIRTPYKIVLNNKEETNEFYKLLKALFIMQTELPHYYNFETGVNSSGELEFYYNSKKIEYYALAQFINQEYKLLVTKEINVENEQEILKEKLQKLQIEGALLDADYIAKEKQISTYLECKKSFLGKVKYFIKYGKKSKKQKEEMQEENEELEELQEEISPKTEITEKESNQYTLEELINRYKEFAKKEDETKNTIMDINALKLKNKNIKKKIENAAKFIEEIDKHKKSIFEFWKYTNKDEVAALDEGEEETLNVVPKIKRKFDYEQDLESFGQELDKIQRSKLNKDELDSLYILSTEVCNVINSLLGDKLQAKKELDASLKKLKEEAANDKGLNEKEEFDIFGSLIEDGRKVKTIANKNHREIPKDKYAILEIAKNTKSTEYKFSLDGIIKNIREALKKIESPQELVVYKAIPETINSEKLNIFNINPEIEMKEALRGDESKINLYKINVKKEANIIAYTNSVFYDNKNKTLPIGMDLSTRVLLDSGKIAYQNPKPIKTFKVVTYDDEKNELSKIKVKTITVYEGEV